MSNYNEQFYLSQLSSIVENGKGRDDRTGVGTISMFAVHTKYFIDHDFPIPRTKGMNFNAVLAELLWFIEGSTDERRLAELTHGKHRSELEDKKTIWTDNANNQGVALGYPNNRFYKELGPVYGHQWNLSDQLNKFVERLINDPFSRRNIVNAWNVEELDQMALPPCHMMFQSYCEMVNGVMKFDLQMYQRSADYFLGVPYNIVSYSILMRMIGIITGYTPRMFSHVTGDAHVYVNHLDAVTQQLGRTTQLRDEKIESSLFIEDRGQTKLSDFVMADFTLKNYSHMGYIKAPMAI